MLELNNFGGLCTDRPPDQLNGKAFYLENMTPGSAVSMRPRHGVSIIGSAYAPGATGRYIYVSAISGDSNYTCLLTVVNYISTDPVPTQVEGQFEFHPGVISYQYLAALVSPQQVKFIDGAAGAFPAPFGTLLATGVQYGNKFLLYFPDQRPLMFMPADDSGAIKAYWSGIQPPTYYCTAAAGSDDASNILWSDTQPSLNTLIFAYSFYSSRRNVYSQPSPLTYYDVPQPTALTGTLAFTLGSTTLTGTGSAFNTELTTKKAILINGVIYHAVKQGSSNTLATLTEAWPNADLSGVTGYFMPKKVSLTGFFNPRGTSAQNDNGYDADIDYVVVGCQSGTNPGLMVLDPQSFIAVAFNPSTGLYAPSTPTFTFDLDLDLLAFGFDLNALTGALYVPPASKYEARYGERIWSAGQRDSVTFDSSTTLAIEPSNLSGLVSLSAGSATLTGNADTKFSSELEVDDTLRINGTRYTILSVTDNDTATLTVNAIASVTNQPAYRLFRDLSYARLKLTANTPPGPAVETWSNAHLYMSLYANGAYIGEIFDVIDGHDTAYLLGDADSLSVTGASFELVGHNDRIFPSGYDENVPGRVPTPFPETVQLNNNFLLGEALDEGERISGLIAAREALIIAYQNSFTRMSVANDGGGVPEPDFRPYYGRAGCIAPRSLCKLPTGDIAWIGNEGIFIDNGGSVENLLAHPEIESLSLFKGGQWIAKSDLPGMVMAYSRTHNGLVIGNFTINGAANWWGLIAMQPQMALCLFSGQSITSNLLTYLDGNGSEVLIAGDNRGRIKQLLDDTQLADLATSGTSTSSYLCTWQGGWNGKPDGSTWNLARLRAPGLLCPFEDDLEMTITIHRNNFMKREIQNLPAKATTTVVLTEKHFVPGRDIAIAANESRFISVGFTHSSTTGNYSSGLARPMEVLRIIGMERNE